MRALGISLATAIILLLLTYGMMSNASQESSLMEKDSSVVPNKARSAYVAKAPVRESGEQPFIRPLGPIESVTIDGPTTGVVQADYAFVATANPITATQPITYVWQAKEQTTVTHTNRGLSDIITFTWDTTGTKTITVTASNIYTTMTDNHIIAINVPPGDVNISGPPAGLRQTPYSFTATVTPPTTTLPITNVWQATGQTSVVTHTSRLTTTDIVTFTWSAPGPQTITVTASNAWGTVTDSHTITINVPPGDVNIRGPIAGVRQTVYPFTVSVRPITTTLPITYVWQTTGQGNVITKTGGGLSDAVTLTWDTAGPKTITVTADNAWGAPTGTHHITITSSPITPTKVKINGPTTGAIQVGHAFTATVSPLTTTPPITYVWQATEQTSVVTHTSWWPTDTATFTWHTTGTQAITLTAMNSADEISATHIITTRISLLTGVVITGPTEGVDQIGYDFVATVTPLTATRPITYVWQATGPLSETHEGWSLSDSVTFRWGATGTQTVTVRATNNPGDKKVFTHTITISEARKRYLPLVLRGWPPIPPPPQLHSIDNADGDDSYTVQWSEVSSSYPITYYLQETQNCEADFTDATEVYSGTSTSYDADDQSAGRHYYRVRACNNWICGDWSNIRWVDVWDQEPNDSRDQEHANGPLCSGLTYFGTFPSRNDQSDYFYFEMDVPHSIEIWLTNIQSGHDYDLYLYDAAGTLIGRSDRYGSADEHILIPPPPSLNNPYYVRVYNFGKTGNTVPYHLRVVYK